MMEKFTPDMYQKSIYHIDYEKLLDSGIKCLLFDLDNTCVPYKDKVPNKKLIDLFENLKDMDFKIIIFSNATKNRLKPFKDILNVDCLARAKKPNKKNFLKVMKLFKYNLSDMAIIGDQLYKDILGGNKVGIKTILVNPMSRDDFFLTTLIFRNLEKRVYKNLHKKGLLVRGKYYE
ncbi:MAG: YqeG family HAD IIIA-type phosphatase [Bacilli bacterium]|nr:YqeG family HAD IIIA-type phosphatase [Bacilli bacterium]